MKLSAIKLRGIERTFWDRGSINERQEFLRRIVSMRNGKLPF